jgi:hypothetical protein
MGRMGRTILSRPSSQSRPSSLSRPSSPIPPLLPYCRAKLLPPGCVPEMNASWIEPAVSGDTTAPFD